MFKYSTKVIKIMWVILWCQEINWEGLFGPEKAVEASRVAISNE
jgi:hypothetical protein